MHFLTTFLPLAAYSTYTLANPLRIDVSLVTTQDFNGPKSLAGEAMVTSSTMEAPSSVDTLPVDIHDELIS